MSENTHTSPVENQTMTLTIRFVAEALIDELCSMVEQDQQKGTEYQSAFLGKKTKDRTVAIGNALLKFGGEDLMVHAYYKVLERHGVMSARMLECSWDGIGDWLG
jgi:hypothetical protein